MVWNRHGNLVFPTTGDGVLFNRTTHGTSATVSAAQQIVGVTAVPVTVTLASAIVEAGAWLIVNDESGSATATDPVTIDTEGTETIDGAASITLENANASIMLYSDGTNWFTGANPPSVI